MILGWASDYAYIFVTLQKVVQNESYHINFHFNNIRGNRLMFNNVEINKNLEKISLLN